MNRQGLITEANRNYRCAILRRKGRRAHKDALTQETVHVPVTLQKLGAIQSHTEITTEVRMTR